MFKAYHFSIIIVKIKMAWTIMWYDVSSCLIKQKLRESKVNNLICWTLLDHPNHCAMCIVPKFKNCFVVLFQEGVNVLKMISFFFMKYFTFCNKLYLTLYFLCNALYCLIELEYLMSIQFKKQNYWNVFNKNKRFEQK